MNQFYNNNPFIYNRPNIRHYFDNPYNRHYFDNPYKYIIFDRLHYYNNQNQNFNKRYYNIPLKSTNLNVNNKNPCETQLKEGHNAVIIEVEENNKNNYYCVDVPATIEVWNIKNKENKNNIYELILPSGNYILLDSSMEKFIKSKGGERYALDKTTYIHKDSKGIEKNIYELNLLGYNNFGRKSIRSKESNTLKKSRRKSRRKSIRSKKSNTLKKSKRSKKSNTRNVKLQIR